jgi:hypothetical protein
MLIYLGDGSGKKQLGMLGATHLELGTILFITSMFFSLKASIHSDSLKCNSFFELQGYFSNIPLS